LARLSTLPVIAPSTCKGFARGIEARRAETTGSARESPVPPRDAPPPWPDSDCVGNLRPNNVTPGKVTGNIGTIDDQLIIRKATKDMPWNENLDPRSPAYGIAAAEERFIRVVAGPGTGKSFAPKRRVARLLEEGADPKRILPVTFTNVAAEDLQREMLLVGVPGCEAIRGSTLHSLCMRILSRQNVLESIARIPRPLNRFEMEPLLYDLSNAFGNKRARSKKIRAYEAAWARLQHEQPGHAPSRDDLAFESGLVGWLVFHKGMLIGEIIPYVYRYLRDNPAAPEREMFDFILVDEYQDLNKAEQAVIDLLTGDGHVCIVGDDDQSLYSFKHAHPAGIREFHLSHDETADHEILECRRCPTRVVAMANALIAHNRDREARQLVPRAENGAGEVMIVQYASLADEAAGIARIVADLVNNQGYAPQDVLVLAQRRSVGNPIHDALSGLNVPSKSHYQEGVLDNLSAQERLAILKLYVDRQDRIALRWLLGYGSNDFRSGAYARLRTYCEDNGAEPWDVMAGLSNGEIRIPHTQHLVTRFREIQNELVGLGGHESLKDFVPAWLHIDDNDPFHRLVLDLALGVETPDELLNAVIVAVSQPDVPPDVTEVRIMSLHKSKGLSSPVVIIAGCVEGLLPTASDAEATPAENEAALEEQRRLFFVGLTRVKANPGEDRPGVLVLTSSRTMSLADAMQSGIRPARVEYGTAHVHASRFIQELGPSAPATQRA
jgi:DNA helicase II / ATP-dependent DNA helicase PcrA